MLKCISQDQADYVISEIHEDVCGNPLGARKMVAKVLKAGTTSRLCRVTAQNLFENA